MSITQNGNTLVWDGTVTITNSTDITTGVATLMLTPQGGTGNLPALAQGLPGQPALFDSVTASTLAAGASATANIVQVSGGGAGIAAHYTLALGIPQGVQGVAGTSTISGATDLEGGPPSAATDQYTIKWQNADSKWKIAGQLCGDTFNAVTFTPASGNGSPQTLCTVSIPAQPFDWRPRVSGFATATGTANTHVDLQVRLNNATSGDQVGYGWGITGAGSGSIPAYPINLIQVFGSAIGAGSYGRVSKGNSATIYFNAIQTANTTDAFTISAASCGFSLKIDPIPGTS